MKNVVKRNGEFQEFDMTKIKAAVIKAAIQDGKYDDKYANTIGEFVMNDTVAIIGDDVDSITVEDIQDLVEEILMEYNKQIAKTYIIYRNDRAQKRKNKSIAEFNTLANNKFSFQYYVNVLLNEYTDLHDYIFETGVKVWSNSIDKNNTIQMLNLLIIELRSQIQYEPKYSNVCADILNDIIFLENFNTVYKELPNEKDATSAMPIELFLLLDSLEYGMRVNRISRNVINAYTGADLYDIALHAINSIKRGDKTLIGIQTLYDRYLLHDNDNHYESVHGMFVRVALGLGHTEEQETRIEKTKAFFDLMYSTLYMPSTPTLFNSGTIRPQLSSCYLTTIPDDLLGIYEGITDDAMLSKYAGGIGNDWTQVRGLGSHIAGTNGKSQGVIPFMKVVNDTAVAVNQGGKRRGAICSYLETWHIDIEDFLDLRKNTGDERRRTHDMNTANWIPDLFMERVLADETWTLFSPDETPDLHDLIGIKFKARYEVYEQMARDGTIKLFKTVSAKTLWRKMLTMLFETGHPWVTFKDAFNTRYSNQHVGVIHSSNLCFTGDTMIATADGRNAVSIKQLAEESQRVNMIDVYSARRKVGSQSSWKTEIKPAIAFNTGVKDVIEVTLSDGSRFNCTPDHKLFTPSGDAIEAQHAIGTTIESFFTYTNVDKQSKYRHINSITNGHAKQHIMIYEHANNDVSRKAYINNTLKNGLTVVGIEAIEPEDVYCLTVDVNHNFYIITQTDDAEYLNCSGILVKNCTEIGLHTNDDEIAVCNLGSVNVTKLVTGYFTLDEKLIEKTVTTAVRMLDNVIDYNYYSVDKAFTANAQHRPIGLGILGFQDALYMLGIPYDSPEAVDFADYLQEVISYYAISASCDLARERGAYSTFEGSLWSKGILPIDSLQMLAGSRADGLLVSNSCRMPMAMWDDLRDRVKKYGMRNSNVMAIAPTATISNICGVSQSIEPTYQNVYVKSNLSGEFITINTFLVDELKKLGLWNNSIARQIINKDGSVQDIIGIPAHIKALFKTAFEIDSVWLINAASRRQKWIDQGQSLNLYMKNPSGKKLNDLYTMAWMSGLKSTYYLRTMAATGNEKTIDDSDAIDVTPATDMKFCSIDNPDCESCS